MRETVPVGVFLVLAAMLLGMELAILGAYRTTGIPGSSPWAAVPFVVATMQVVVGATAMHAVAERRRAARWLVVLAATLLLAGAGVTVLAFQAAPHNLMAVFTVIATVSMAAYAYSRPMDAWLTRAPPTL